MRRCGRALLVLAAAAALVATVWVSEGAQAHVTGGRPLNWPADTRPDAEILAERAENARGFETCRYQRKDAIACSVRYADTDRDGHISEAEVEAMMQRYLSAPMRLGAWLAATFKRESAGTIVRKCDYDGDGLISRSDFELSFDTCLNKCAKVELFFSLICNKALADERKRAFEDELMMLTAA